MKYIDIILEAVPELRRKLPYELWLDVGDWHRLAKPFEIGGAQIWRPVLLSVSPLEYHVRTNSFDWLIRYAKGKLLSIETRVYYQDKRIHSWMVFYQ